MTILWPRAILHMDMDAYFAAIEQHDCPALRGQPIAITNGSQGTCIITSSYEARAYGVRTGMRLYVARKLCPRLRQIPSRPQRYMAVSRAIMAALENITPIIEIFSVDEAFLDVTGCQRLLGTPEHMAKMTKQHVFNVSGLTCSVGVSGDKSTAKYASGLNKPDGLTVILPWEAKDTLAPIPVEELCGINSGIKRFLAQYGVLTCGDMAKLPISVLGKRFGNLGKRLWLMCQGLDISPVETHVNAPKSMGHGKILPPNTTNSEFIQCTLLALCEKLAARLRRHNMQAQHFFIGLRHRQFGWLGEKINLIYPTQDSRLLYKHALRIFRIQWHGEPICHCQVTACDPHPAGQQLSLLETANTKQANLNKVIDAINDRYGSNTVASAKLLKHESSPEVIAPAWRPSGHRQSLSIHNPKN